MKLSDFLEKNGNLLDELIVMSSNAADRIDYIQGGGGNTSVKLNDGLMAIKASGFSMGQMNRENAYAVLDVDRIREFYLKSEISDFDDVEKAGSEKTKESVVAVEGLTQLRPSVEAGFHSVLDKFVLHTHSVYANFLSCTKEGESLLDNVFKDADYGYGWVPYVDPGATLTYTIMDVCEKVEKNQGKKAKILIMENHGIISHGASREEAEKLHEDANKRLAKYFNSTFEDFPEIKISKDNESWLSATPWLKEMLATGEYSPDFFMNKSLYPDQLVFLWENLVEVGEKGKAVINLKTGDVTYNTNYEEAIVIEKTLCCVIFIIQHIGKKGLTLKVMNEENRGFILGWESEAYRKSLLK